VNGWTVNGVSTFQSGTPITVFDGSTFTLQDLDGINGTNFATLAPGATLASAVTSGNIGSRLGSYLNLSAFTPGGNCVNNQNVVVPCQINGAPNPAAAGAAIGNVGRNTFRGPFQQNWDLSITKNTKVTEATSVDFRAEFFNAFNHPVFSGPQSGGFGSATGNLGLVNIAKRIERYFVNGEPSPDHPVCDEVQLLMWMSSHFRINPSGSNCVPGPEESRRLREISQQVAFIRAAGTKKASSEKKWMRLINSSRRNKSLPK